ncbi:MAG: sigma-70 family RNA polymerase sigma factor [Clostridiales bacterium]|nr:sigma-70 family RNA polymerase sigma factor [Clostridiales bacterium]
MQYDELDLVNRCRGGDLAAYDQIMQQYEKKVYSLCFRMAGNHDDAADLAQEAFLKAFRALPSFKGESAFATWLYRIVTNTCLDEKRRVSKRPFLVSLDKKLETEDGELALTLPGDSPDPLKFTLDGELQREIQALLGKLPSDQRIVVVMRDIDGYSYEEMADTLQLSMGTLKSRLNRARSKLRELYLREQEHFRQEVHLKEKGGWSHDM